MQTTKLNGVDLTELKGQVEAITAEPELATRNIHISNRWIDGAENVSVTGDHPAAGQVFASNGASFEVRYDDPKVMLTGGEGPNPLENLLHALAGCLTTTLVSHAAARGVRVDAVRTRFEGDLDLRGFLGLSGEVRNGYRQIRAIFDIEGDFDASVKGELMQLALERSPVFDVVSNGVSVICDLADTHASSTAAA